MATRVDLDEGEQNMQQAFQKRWRRRRHRHESPGEGKRHSIQNGKATSGRGEQRDEELTIMDWMWTNFAGHERGVLLV